ncbi:hypothetical protein, partial [Salmonella enterica]
MFIVMINSRGIVSLKYPFAGWRLRLIRHVFYADFQISEQQRCGGIQRRATAFFSAQLLKL